MPIENVGDLYEDVFINNRLISLQNTSNYMYAKVTEIFRYEGLPLTLPKRILELCVTKNGAAVVYEYDGELFVTDELPGTEPNLYQEETEVSINHRVGSVNERITRTIGVDAVLFRNDSLSIGLDPIITEFSILSAQAKITMIRNLVDLRGNYIIQAKDENAYKSALEYERAIRRGDTAIILAEEFSDMEGIVVHSTPISNNPATQTVELFQYIQSYYYSELGIELNNNMKREYVSDTEIEKSSGMPLIHNMLELRREAVRDIKALFGVDITVSLSSEWKDQEEEESNGPQVGTEGGKSEELEAGDATGTGTAPQVGTETGTETGSETGTGTEAEVEEEVTREELVDATEALLGKEVDDEEVEDDSAADDSDSDANSDED